MKSKCMDCPEREPGCHARCPDGIELDRRNKERREQIRKAKEKENAADGHLSDTAGRIKFGRWR